MYTLILDEVAFAALARLVEDRVSELEGFSDPARFTHAELGTIFNEKFAWFKRNTQLTVEMNTLVDDNGYINTYEWNDEGETK